MQENCKNMLPMHAYTKKFSNQYGVVLNPSTVNLILKNAGRPPFPRGNFKGGKPDRKQGTTSSTETQFKFSSKRSQSAPGVVPDRGELRAAIELLKSLLSNSGILELHIVSTGSGEYETKSVRKTTETL